MPEIEVTLTLLGLMFAAGVLAGWIDAVVGGGGLVQLPALLLGLPQAAPVQVLATNKIAAIAGTSVAATTYYRRVRPDLRTAVPLAVLAFAGSFLGARVASAIPQEAFTPIIMVVLLLVGAYTLTQKELGREARLRFDGHRHLAVAMLAGAVIGFYDGALGPGTGSFLVFALVGLLGFDFLAASAKAKLANLATNLAALVVFIPMGAVVWKVGAVMAAGNVVGGYLGARTAVARGGPFVRVVFMVVVGAFLLRLGWDLAATHL
ncbi:TSUP family transporter [Kytococcus sp. Marseille-QA3725]